MLCIYCEVYYMLLKDVLKCLPVMWSMLSVWCFLPWTCPINIILLHKGNLLRPWCSKDCFLPCIYIQHLTSIKEFNWLTHQKIQWCFLQQSSQTFHLYISSQRAVENDCLVQVWVAVPNCCVYCDSICKL